MGILRKHRKASITKTVIMRLTPRMLKQLPYPYTFGAQIKAFPAKFHFDNLWVIRAWALGMVLTAPIFLKIQWQPDTDTLVKVKQIKKRRRDKEKLSMDINSDKYN